MGRNALEQKIFTLTEVFRQIYEKILDDKKEVYPENFARYIDSDRIYKAIAKAYSQSSGKYFFTTKAAKTKAFAKQLHVTKAFKYESKRTITVCVSVFIKDIDNRAELPLPPQNILSSKKFLKSIYDWIDEELD